MNLNNEIKREIIMDHYAEPRNKRHIDDTSYASKHMASDSCIDDITVYIKTCDDRVIDAAFDGVGCTISTASTSIFTELIKGKTVSEALELIHEYENMISEKTYDEDKLQELNAFSTLSKQANRINCGLIGARGFKTILEESKNGRKE